MSVSTDINISKIIIEKVNTKLGVYLHLSVSLSFSLSLSLYIYISKKLDDVHFPYKNDK